MKDFKKIKPYKEYFDVMSYHKIDVEKLWYAIEKKLDFFIEHTLFSYGYLNGKWIITTGEEIILCDVLDIVKEPYGDNKKIELRGYVDKHFVYRTRGKRAVNIHLAN